MLKKGANVTDRAKIAKAYAAGKTAEEIGFVLGIEVDVVRRFSPEEVKKAEAAQKARREAEARAAADEDIVPAEDNTGGGKKTGNGKKDKPSAADDFSVVE